MKRTIGRFVAAAVIVALGSSKALATPPDIGLPFMAGDTWWCAQGWNGSVSHSGEDAWDYNYGTGANDLGYPLLAPDSGRIVFAGRSKQQSGANSPYGNVVLIDYGDGYYGRLAHQTEIVVSVGEKVEKGQVVGFCGTTGVTDDQWPSHIHYNTQGTANPATKDMTEVYVDFKNYLGQTVTDGYPDPCDCSSSPPASTFYTSVNSNIIDLRKSTALNDRNPYAVSQSPNQWLGGTAGSIGWYHAYNPNSLYQSGTNTAVNCYRTVYGGGFYAGAVVYDALGGARHAYCVGDQEWATWDNLEAECSGSCPTPSCSDGPSGQGGPNSALGMPITNRYKYTENPDHWRQDFQKGYIQDGTTIKCNTTTTPGWTSSGWNNQYSYLFTDAYDRNGARRDVGNPSSGNDGQVHVLSGSILIQEFTGGDDGSGRIMYDQENWECNTSATNEAYWVYGSIKSRYDELGGVNLFGCATIDRFYLNGKWCQDFKNSAGTQHRIYETGSPAVDVLGTCSGGTYHAAGSDSSESFANLTVTPIAGDWNGDGIFEVGVYADETQTFYLDTNNDGYTELELHYSSAVDKPLAGDWDGNTYYSVGFYRPAYRVFYLDYDNNGQMDIGITYGDGGDIPLAGDWLGNGYTRIGIFRHSTRTFWLDYDNNGVADFSVTFGDNGDIPLVGDWDCDLDWNIGIYRPSTRTFWLDYDNDHVADFSRTYGDAGDSPIVGDWTGNCGTNIGVFRPSTQEFWLDYNSDGYADRCIVIRRTIPGSPKITAHGGDNTLPRTFSLSQNYPNPFNPGTTIRYTLPVGTHVRLDIYNILGQRIETLADENQLAGEHTAQWNALQYASGMYFYRLVTDQAVEIKKMVLLK